jgi:hypothetical protein
MRSLPWLVCLGCLLAASCGQAGNTFSDPASGIVITGPDGWDREDYRHGSLVRWVAPGPAPTANIAVTSLALSDKRRPGLGSIADAAEDRVRSQFAVDDIHHEPGQLAGRPARLLRYEIPAPGGSPLVQWQVLGLVDDLLIIVTVSHRLEDAAAAKTLRDTMASLRVED